MRAYRRGRVGRDGRLAERRADDRREDEDVAVDHGGARVVVFHRRCDTPRADGRPS